MTEGWVSLHRKLFDNPIWKVKPFSRGQAWIDLLLLVNWKDEKVLLGLSIIDCKRGQTVRSLDTLAKRWGWSKSAVRRFLNLLQNENMVVTENVVKTTRITICNYESYQEPRNDGGTIVNQSRHDREPIAAPNEQDNKVTMKQEKKPPRLAAPIDLDLCGEFQRAITKIDPLYLTNGVIKATEKWPDEFRKLREIDGRSVEDIRAVIQLLPAHEFWSAQIRSPKALRGETHGGADKFLKVIGDLRRGATPNRSETDGLPRLP